jgi:hypothetical protein
LDTQKHFAKLVHSSLICRTTQDLILSLQTDSLQERYPLHLSSYQVLQLQESLQSNRLAVPNQSKDFRRVLAPVSNTERIPSTTQLVINIFSPVLTLEIGPTQLDDLTTTLTLHNFFYLISLNRTK